MNDENNYEGTFLLVANCSDPYITRSSLPGEHSHSSSNALRVQGNHQLASIT